MILRSSQSDIGLTLSSEQETTTEPWHGWRCLVACVVIVEGSLCWGADPTGFAEGRHQPETESSSATAQAWVLAPQAHVTGTLGTPGAIHGLFSHRQSLWTHARLWGPLSLSCHDLPRCPLRRTPLHVAGALAVASPPSPSPAQTLILHADFQTNA